jgi:hypothetical protein
MVMNAETVFRILGGQRHGHSFLCRCPVPGHGQGRGDRNPSLSVRDGDAQLLVKCHGGCQTRDVLDELRRLGLLDPSSRHLHEPTRPVPSRDDDDGIRRALAIWHEARDPRGTLVEHYLANRCLGLPADIAGHALRYHARCPFGPGERQPCMVALFRDIRTDEPVAIHRTALTPDGRKIGRKMLGPAGGSAIKLDADDAVSMGLVVGEGVESCLSARQLGYRPCWALGSKGAIGTLPTLAGIEALTILAEPDAAEEVQACGTRWFSAGREVILVRPVIGKDMNDVVRGAA